MSETSAVHPPIRTFHPRRGRMSTRHTDAHATHCGRPTGSIVADGDRTPLDLPALFGRVAPVVLEIGFGMGESTAAMAGADPGRDYLGVEVHTPGIGNLLALLGEHGLTNVRVAHGDAMQLVHRIAPAALDAVHVFFPDPWPKARHHKRRLIRPANVALLRDRLRPGGRLHCATDWPRLRRRDDRDAGRRPGAAPGHGRPRSATGNQIRAARRAGGPADHGPHLRTRVIGRTRRLSGGCPVPDGLPVFRLCRL